MSQRTSGILLHLTSLANRYPVGDLGPAAYAFADFMRNSGQTYWQTLPVGPTGMENSPYDGPSAFSGNPLLISPDRLMEQGFLSRNEIESSIRPHTGHVNYAEAAHWKLQLLKKSFERFQQRIGCHAALHEFVDQASFWLDDFSLYLAIEAKEGTANWTMWDPDLRTRQPAAIARVKTLLANDIQYHQFVQWQFALQWHELKVYCNDIGIQLIGDIPLFVAHQSADVWAHSDIFKLDADGDPIVVAGVPPDCFSKTGQLWNVPVYCWETLHDQHYTWWVQRVLNALRRFDRVRLDHFIGFVQTYEVQAKATTALDGEYRAGGGMGVFQAIRDAVGGLPFIAEDLGAKTSEVDALRNQLQIPGMRVLQFELNDNPMPSEYYPENTVIYTGTHDNDTTLGWYQTLADAERTRLASQLDVSPHEVNWALICKAFTSNAEVAIIPMQDMLGLGSTARMNVPGEAKGNWRWRLEKDVLTESLTERLQHLTKSAGRT